LKRAQCRDSVLSASGNWDRVFIASAIITITAGILAKLELAPMRARWVDTSNQNSGPGGLGKAAPQGAA
jgi:OFA family oxalate/formate antiporter-like MFS transporter